MEQWFVRRGLLLMIHKGKTSLYWEGKLGCWTSMKTAVCVYVYIFFSTRWSCCKNSALKAQPDGNGCSWRTCLFPQKAWLCGVSLFYLSMWDKRWQYQKCFIYLVWCFMQVAEYSGVIFLCFVFSLNFSASVFILLKYSLNMSGPTIFSSAG